MTPTLPPLLWHIKGPGDLSFRKLSAAHRRRDAALFHNGKEENGYADKHDVYQYLWLASQVEYPNAKVMRVSTVSLIFSDLALLVEVH